MEDSGKENGLSYPRLALVCAALLCLTALTVWVSRQNLGSMKIAAALSIASVKATLVLLFFMNVRRAGTAVPIAFIATIMILAVLIIFIFFDIAYR